MLLDSALPTPDNRYSLGSRRVSIPFAFLRPPSLIFYFIYFRGQSDLVIVQT